MTKEELLSHKERYTAKLLEMKAAMQKLETEYILANVPYKIGQKIKYTDKDKKKEIEKEGVVASMELDYTFGLRVLVCINDEKTGFIAKFLYI
jgi:hypothetical protein